MRSYHSECALWVGPTASPVVQRQHWGLAGQALQAWPGPRAWPLWARWKAWAAGPPKGHAHCPPHQEGALVGHPWQRALAGQIWLDPPNG